MNRDQSNDRIINEGGEGRGEARLNRERSYNVDDYKIWSVANITFYLGEEGLYTIIRSFGIKVENIVFRSQSMIFDPPQWINEKGIRIVC